MSATSGVFCFRRPASAQPILTDLTCGTADSLHDLSRHYRFLAFTTTVPSNASPPGILCLRKAINGFPTCGESARQMKEVQTMGGLGFMGPFGSRWVFVIFLVLILLLLGDA